MKTGLPLPLLDAHVHLTASRGIAPLLELERAAGLDRLAIVCVPGTPERSLACNAQALLAKALNPKAVYVFGGLHYRADRDTSPEGLRRQAEDLWEAGCDGIKLLEGKPTSRKRIPFAMDDPVYDPFYAFLEERGIPIVWHVGDPETFWDPAQVPSWARANGWFYADGTFPALEELYGEVDRALEKHPRLRAVFGHFYFLSNQPERAARFLDRWPEVSFDITPGTEMYANFSRQPAVWREFFIRFQDRIVFGTDNAGPYEPWEPARAEMADKVRVMRQFLELAGPVEGFRGGDVKEVAGLGLPEPVCAKIYSRNFERYAGRTPRPLNRDVAVRLARQTLEYARQTPGQEELALELAAVERALGKD